MPAPTSPRRPRVGVTLGPDRSHAALLDGGLVVAQASVPGADLRRLLRALPRPDVDGVTLDISRMLSDTARSAGGTGRPRVAVLRIVPRPATDDALGRHPATVVEDLVHGRFTVGGGSDLFGRALRELDLAGAERLAGLPAVRDADGIAVVAAGSHAQPRQELAVAAVLRRRLPSAHLSLAADLGGQGLVAREATAVLDAALGRRAADLLDEAEDAAGRLLPGAALTVARGDGGWASLALARAHPVLGVGAGPALQLQGAAALAGRTDCRVVLSPAAAEGPAGHVPLGEVRHGLASVQPYGTADLGTALVVPTAALTWMPPAAAGSAAGTADLPLVTADGDPLQLACVGAAVSRPTAWLDEIAVIDSTERLAEVRRDAQERATAIVTANGAAPGTATVVEMSAVAVPYSPSGTVRVRVRIAGVADDRIGIR
ncbi:hypothetical protein [Nakamurella endophytica]|nr:hypothetical protein [Nakamurella endophytica]